MAIAADWERRRRLETLRQEAKNKRAPMMPIWQTLVNNFIPEGWSIQSDPSSQVDRSQALGSRIIDNHGGAALDTFVAGINGVLTNPARPWFNLQPEDAELAELQSVKLWCDDTRTRIANALLKSNAYQVLPLVYSDLGLFGTSAVFVDEDPTDVIRLYSLPIGSYCLITDAAGRVVGIVREWSMTVQQMVDEYGIDNVSTGVRDQYKLGNGTQQNRDVVQIIIKNDRWDDRKPLSKFKKFYSCTYETGSPNSSPEEMTPSFLREMGYDQFPCLGIRWKIIGTNVYGSSLGTKSIGDVLQLQQLQRKKLQAIDKMVNPPMQVPDSVVNTQINMLPGGINVIPSTGGSNTSISPLFNINFDIKGVLEDIGEVHNRIDRAFYADLWLLISNIDRGDVTATEIQAKQDEKLQQLGTPVGRITTEGLSPLIERVYAIMLKRGLLAEPPEELRGIELKIDYVSTFAQALKLASSAGLGRFLGLVGNMAQTKPDIVDKVDLDEAVDQFADELAVPPSVVRSDEQVAKIRAARAKAQEQAAQAQQFQQVAQGAELLSKTPINANTALNAVLGQ